MGRGMGEMMGDGGGMWGGCGEMEVVGRWGAEVVVVGGWTEVRGNWEDGQWVGGRREGGKNMENRKHMNIRKKNANK